MNSALGSGVSIECLLARLRLSAYLSRALQIIIFNSESIKYWPLDQEGGRVANSNGNMDTQADLVPASESQTLKNCSHREEMFNFFAIMRNAADALA